MNDMNDRDLKGGAGFDFGSDGTMDIVAYIVAFLGVLFSFFNPTVGGVLVGVVVGIYFADEVMAFLKGLEARYHSLGMCKAIVAGAGLVALVISIPTLFITSAIVGAVASMVKPGKKSGRSSEPRDED